MTRVQCERSRKGISLQLDGMLSTFEVALLNRHLRGCPSCRTFAANVTEQAQLLRSTELEHPSRPVVISVRPSRVRRNVGGAFSAALVAAAASLMLVLPGVRQHGADQSPRVSVGVAPMIVVVAAKPTLASKVEVPRLRVQPASAADGPVHGPFGVPFV